jgi:glucokinase
MNMIVADIGGTHARYGLLDNGKITKCNKIKVTGYNNATALFEHIAEQEKLEKPLRLAIAAAGNMRKDNVWRVGNNNNWEISPTDLEANGFELELLINDFKASARGITELSQDQLITLREGSTISDKPYVICGPGTGLGLAYLLPLEGNKYHVNRTEGGHMLAVTRSREQQLITGLIARLNNRGEGVTYEDIISGRGLRSLYEAVAFMYGTKQEPPANLDLKNINETVIGKNVLRLFHEFLGSFVQSAALYGNSTGGIYLDGGVIKSIYENGLFDEKSFFEAMHFVSHKRIKEILTDIPIYLINTSYIALYGVARLWEERMLK